MPLREVIKNGTRTVTVCDFSSFSFYLLTLIPFKHVPTVFHHMMKLIWKPWDSQEISMTKKKPSWPNLCCFCQPWRQQFFQMFCQKGEFIASYLEGCFCAYFLVIVISFGPRPSCDSLRAKLKERTRWWRCEISEWHLSLIITPDYCMSDVKH